MIDSLLHLKDQFNENCGRWAIYSSDNSKYGG